MAAGQAVILWLLLLASCASAAVESARSYKAVHRERSMYRNIIVADAIGHGARCITFGVRHPMQSCVNRDQPQLLELEYTRPMVASFFIHPAPRSALIIGAGAGVIPMALRQLSPELKIDVVELDAAVVRVAQQYFFLTPDPKLLVHVDDGRVFVRKQLQRGARYDVIVVDAFERDYIPEHLLTAEFFRQLQTLLAPGGLLVANTFARGVLQGHEAVTYQAVYGATYQIDMPGGNRIILAGREAPRSVEWMLSRMRLHGSALREMGIDLSVIERGLKLQTVPTGYRILTDQFSPANLMIGKGESR